MRDDDYSPLAGDATDFEGEDVAIIRDPQGRAALLPRSVAKLGPVLGGEVRGLLESAAELQERQAAIADRVGDLRDRGVSWGVIGWAVGTTSEAARKRWGS